MLCWFLILGVLKLSTHMGDADFHLCSDNRLVGTERDFLFSFPSQAPYNYRTAGETVGLWICLNSMSAPRSETRPLEFEPAFAFGLSWMKSGEIYSINSSDIARAASCLPRVRARLPACTEIVGLPCLASLLVECRTRDQKKFRVRIPAGTA